MTHDDASRDAQTPFSEPRQPTEAAGQNPRIRKDLWDKLSAVSTFLSGVLIAAIGLLFTYLHNESEGQRNTSLKISESHIAETRAFEKFIPYLNSAKEADINIGLIGISSLNKELGGRVLIYFSGYGVDPQKKVASAIITQRRVHFFNSWNDKSVDPPPPPEKRRPALFHITRLFAITDIRSYHYNRNRGSVGKRVADVGPASELPATIMLRRKDGAEFGPWIATPKNGNKDWFCNPNVVLPPGEYEIIDSDPETWSFNEQSDYVGMSIVWGFALD